MVSFANIGNSQIIDGLPLFDSYDISAIQISDFPLFKIKNYGTGNYGFDSNCGYYNPKFIKEKFGFILNSKAILNNPKRDYVLQSNTTSISKNNSVIKPDLQLGYSNRVIFFQILYKSDMDLNMFFIEPLSYRYVTTNGNYQKFFDPSVKTNNSVIQLSGSLNFKDKVSLSLGVLSNKFEYELSGDNNFSLNFERSFFDNYQLLLSLNYIFDKGALYLFGKSQNPVLSLSIQESGIVGNVLWPFRSKISYPGLFAYGFQYHVSDITKLSLELAHEFLNYTEEFVKNEFQNKEIFNTELIAGSNVKILNNFSAGLLVSYYLKYDVKDGLPWIGWSYVEKSVKLDNPFMTQFSLNYNYNQFSFSFWYQYSFSKYEFSEDWYIADSAHLLSIGFGIEL